MFKLFLAAVSLLSVVGFVIAAPIPVPAPQGLIGSVLGEPAPTGGNSGPNGTSESSDPLTGLLTGSANEGASSNGPNGTVQQTGLITSALDALL